MSFMSISREDTAYPQMPVLLIAIVISPGCKLSPFSTSSLLGTASPTQRSCAGLVYTPMLAFEDATSVIVVEDMSCLVQRGISQRMS